MNAQVFFRRGVAEAVVREELTTLLEHSARPLRIKFGVDPSSPHLTLGHVACFRKLNELQQMGHRVVVVIGDWTARIGDPSGRSKSRPMLDASTVNYISFFIVKYTCIRIAVTALYLIPGLIAVSLPAECYPGSRILFCFP